MLAGLTGMGTVGGAGTLRIKNIAVKKEEETMRSCQLEIKKHKQNVADTYLNIETGWEMKQLKLDVFLNESSPNEYKHIEVRCKNLKNKLMTTLSCI